MPIKAVDGKGKEVVQEVHGQTRAPATDQRSTMAIAPALINLQRTYGNRFVQRLLSRARMGDREAEAAPEIEQAIKQADGGQPLESRVRTQMESAMGADFSDVRVHTNAEANTLNRALSARAFTTGKDIFFRQGEYDPGSAVGRQLLAHELAHVLQQRGGGVQRKLTISEPGDACEQEAERVAQAVMQQERESESGGAEKTALTGSAVKGVARATAQVQPATLASARPQIKSGLRIALQGGGGGSGSGPAPTPPTPTVTVSIGPVNSPNTPAPIRRIPPRVDTNVTVTLSGTATPPITLSIDGASADNGTATINGAATHNLTSTATVRLRGVTQTAPSHAGNLKLVANQGATHKADSNLFSVAAYPSAIGMRFNAIERGVTLPSIPNKVWAASYDVTFVSDSGTPGDCDQTKISENVLVDTGTGIWAGNPPIQSNFLTTTTAQTDHHGQTAVDSADFLRLLQSDTSSRAIFHQFFRFSDARSGIAEDRAAGPKVPTSGFKITHTISSSCGGSTFMTAKKEGFANNGVAAGTVTDSSVKNILP